MVVTKVLEVGDKAPSFSFLDQKEKKQSLEEYKGKWVVLYFYPKDDTPGCTIEANDFTALKESFTKLKAEIIGVSPDSTESHEKFCEKHDLTITLASDPNHEIAEKYGAWQLKKNYGKEYWGINRSTFIINPEGKMVHQWTTVKAEGHAEQVKEKLKELQAK